MSPPGGSPPHGPWPLVRPAWLPDRARLAVEVAVGRPYPYYRLQLVEYVCQLLPQAGDCVILDVGAGDGSIGALLTRYRPGTRVIAVETFLRPGRSEVPQFVQFDGARLPFADSTFDVALLLDVLHHATRPTGLLHEVLRVTKRRVLVKDHVARGWIDRARLSLLDVAGNLGSGAVMTGRYLSRPQWDQLLGSLDSVRVTWHRALSFRTGSIARLFPNDLEIMMELDRTREGPRDRGPTRPVLGC